MAIPIRRKIVLAVAVFFVAATSVGLWMQTEPWAEKYKGKSVKGWIEFYAKKGVSDPELEVVRYFGSTALPSLVIGLKPMEVATLIFKALANRVMGNGGPVSIESSEEESRKYDVARNWAKQLLRHDPNVVGEALSLSINERVQLFSAFAEVEHPTNLVARFLTNSNPLIASNAAEVVTIFATVPSPTKPFAPPTAQSGSGVE